MSALGTLQPFIERSVVFISTDAQPFSCGEKHIVAAVTVNVACIDQIGFVNAYKLAIF